MQPNNSADISLPNIRASQIITYIYWHLTDKEASATKGRGLTLPRKGHESGSTAVTEPFLLPLLFTDQLPHSQLYRSAPPPAPVLTGQTSSPVRLLCSRTASIASSQLARVLKVLIGPVLVKRAL